MLLAASADTKQAQRASQKVCSLYRQAPLRPCAQRLGEVPLRYRAGYVSGTHARCIRRPPASQAFSIVCAGGVNERLVALASAVVCFFVSFRLHFS